MYVTMFVTLFVTLFVDGHYHQGPLGAAFSHECDFHIPIGLHNLGVGLGQAGEGGHTRTRALYMFTCTYAC